MRIGAVTKRGLAGAMSLGILIGCGSALGASLIGHGVHFTSQDGSVRCYTWSSQIAVSCEDTRTGANVDIGAYTAPHRGSGVRGGSRLFLGSGRGVRLGNAYGHVD